MPALGGGGDFIREILLRGEESNDFRADGPISENSGEVWRCTYTDQVYVGISKLDRLATEDRGLGGYEHRSKRMFSASSFVTAVRLYKQKASKIGFTCPQLELNIVPHLPQNYYE